MKLTITILVIEINRKGLANFLNDDQGYESGISMYGHYIVCKSLDISSEEEQLNIELKDIVLKILFGPFYNYFVSEYVVSDTIWEEQDKLIEDLYYYFKS